MTAHFPAAPAKSDRQRARIHDARRALYEPAVVVFDGDPPAVIDAREARHARDLDRADELMWPADKEGTRQ